MVVLGEIRFVSHDDDANILVSALGDIVKANGVTDTAEVARLSRESLHKTFSRQVQSK